tara:strand:+ start:15565 stop:16236 length:672 start_codon:yes stop_codon:yes gene_type:complete
VTTWATLQAEIELDLGSDTQWTDAELLMYVNRGIREYSNYFPQIASTVLTTDDSTKAWETPTGFLAVERVEFKHGGEDYPYFLEEIRIIHGSQWYNPASEYPRMWFVEGGEFCLTAAPDTDDVLTLYYRGAHTEMVDGTTVLTVPDKDLELLSLFVASRAAMRVAVDDARLSRWDMKGMDSGNPEHNPVLPIHVQFENEFWDRLFKRLHKTTHIQTQRRGRGL